MHTTTAPVAGPSHAPAATHTPTDRSADGATKTRPRRKRGRPEHFKPDQVIEALEAACGVQKAAAMLLRTSGPVISGYVKRHACVREAQNRIKAAQIKAN